MSDTYDPIVLRPLHPLHAILLAFMPPLFLGVLLADLAYWRSFEVQWANFAAWMNAGGLLVGAFALLWALVDLVRSWPGRRQRAVLYFVLLLAAWGLGLVNAFVHGKDAFAMMPEALFLSVASTVLAFAGAWIGYTGLPLEGFA